MAQLVRAPRAKTPIALHGLVKPVVLLILINLEMVFGPEYAVRQ
jgi:hypothetical protein